MANVSSPLEITCVLTGSDLLGKSIAPLFWQHGEPAGVLREEMQQMRLVGIRQCIVESRPHPDYLGPGWWTSLDTILDEAERLGMRIWVSDDRLYPSGAAGGRIRDRHPHLLKVYLAERVIDARGPLPEASFRIGAWLQPDEQLVGVVAARRIDPDGDALDGTTLVDLSDRVADGRLHWDVPAGWWRLSVLVRTRHGAESDGTGDYLNPLLPEAVDAFLAEVHQAHYDRYSARFGTTIAGFFTDEPRFGNTGSYDAVLGRYAMVLPWCDDLLAELDKDWGGGFRRVLPALWHDAAGVSPRARYRYMDVVSRRFGRNFTGRIGDWCRAHGVRLIGHVVEDNNAHARLGYGAGHFFRALQGQDMGGVDYVFQVWPGLTEGRIETAFSPWDLTFFYWGAAKLASSAGHLDSRKAGMTMCELFGAYGWQLGLTEMKWLTDHACVRGANFLVPHAFSPKYPDPDCPPHFYARGANPQWRHFGHWSAYAERVCHLLSGGRHVAPVAVLYHGEAEWAGRCEYFQHAVRTMAERQIDCDVVSLDALLDDRLTRVGQGEFVVNEERFRCLVVPSAERLPWLGLRHLNRLALAGVRVVFTGPLPAAASDADDAAELLASLRSNPLVTVCSVAELAESLRSWALTDVDVRPACPHLRLYRYIRDNMELLFCVNENPRSPVDVELRLHDSRDPIAYDAMADALLSVPFTRDSDELTVHLRLSPYGSLFLVLTDRRSHFAAAVRPAAPGDGLQMAVEVNGSWEVSTATADTYPAFTAQPTIRMLGDLSRPGRLGGFAGTIAYETDLTVPQWSSGDLWLDLGELYQVSEVFIDGRSLGVRICPTHLYSLERLVSGRHRLRIEVTTTLVERHGDNVFDRAMAQAPMGLLGPVCLLG